MLGKVFLGTQIPTIMRMALCQFFHHEQLTCFLKVNSTRLSFVRSVVSYNNLQIQEIEIPMWSVTCIIM